MNTLVTQTVSHFQPPILMLMVAGGIGGGMIGRRLRRVDDRMVERMFLILRAVIIGISLFNSIWYGRLAQEGAV